LGLKKDQESGVRYQGSASDRLFDCARQLLLGHFGTNEELLAGAVREPDRLPAVLHGDGDTDPNRPLRVANRADDARDDGSDVIAGDEPVEDRPQAVENAVLDLELAFAGAESEGHLFIVAVRILGTWRTGSH